MVTAMQFFSQFNLDSLTVIAQIKKKQLWQHKPKGCTFASREMYARVYIINLSVFLTVAIIFRKAVLEVA